MSQPVFNSVESIQNLIVTSARDTKSTRLTYKFTYACYNNGTILPLIGTPLFCFECADCNGPFMPYLDMQGGNDVGPKDPEMKMIINRDTNQAAYKFYQLILEKHKNAYIIASLGLSTTRRIASFKPVNTASDDLVYIIYDDSEEPEKLSASMIPTANHSNCEFVTVERNGDVYFKKSYYDITQPNGDVYIKTHMNSKFGVPKRKQLEDLAVDDKMRTAEYWGLKIPVGQIQPDGSIARFSQLDYLNPNINTLDHEVPKCDLITSRGPQNHFCGTVCLTISGLYVTSKISFWFMSTTVFMKGRKSSRAIDLYGGMKVIDPLPPVQTVANFNDLRTGFAANLANLATTTAGGGASNGQNEEIADVCDE